MPTKANRLGVYADVREVADLALAHGGGSYDLESVGMAQNFAHRFYRFRQLYREIYHTDGSPCAYDKLICPRVKTPTITFRVREHIGTFRPVSRAAPMTALAPGEDLFDLAQQLAAKLQGEK